MTVQPARMHPEHTARETSETRSIVLWSPDWPVAAATHDLGIDPSAPIALQEGGQVYACSARARAEGVRRGIRIREAQARCTELVVIDRDPSVEMRLFEPVLTALETLTPGVQPLRPGVCAVRARGPARHYGGERPAALALLGCVAELGVVASAGIADGLFSAEQAARSAAPRAVTVVPAGASGGFLAPLPVGVLGVPAITTLLRRLGIRSIGEYAALGAVEVLERFGEEGRRLHLIANGRETNGVVPRLPPESFEESISFEPAIDRIDQAAFAFREPAERFIGALTAARLVCTTLRIELETDDGALSTRSWLHPRTFSAAEVVDRLRWQLQGGTTGSGLAAGIVRVRVIPERVDAIGAHERGLFGDGPDDRVHHALSRVQSMLGHEAVVTAVIGGGRSPGDRMVLVPWGDRGQTQRDPAAPWPARLPDPAPAVVFPARLPLTVLDAAGAPVSIDDRGALSGAPAQLVAPSSAIRAVTAWAGPWPVDERWWDSAGARAAQRFQLVDDTGSAWLLVRDDRGWWAEARYE